MIATVTDMVTFWKNLAIVCNPCQVKHLLYYSLSSHLPTATDMVQTWLNCGKRCGSSPTPEPEKGNATELHAFKESQISNGSESKLVMDQNPNLSRKPLVKAA